MSFTHTNPTQPLKNHKNSNRQPNFLSTYSIQTEDDLALAGALVLMETGENPERESLKNTPTRYSKAMKDLLSGYQQDLSQVIGSGIFDAEGAGLVSVREIEFYSLCEHHLLPFWGKVNVAYFPDRKILGLSKIPRIVDHYSKRIQVQERLTEQIALAIEQTINPRAIAVRIQAYHLCMMMRGIEKQGSHTLTETARRMNNLTSSEQERLWKAL